MTAGSPARKTSSGRGSHPATRSRPIPSSRASSAPRADCPMRCAWRWRRACASTPCGTPKAPRAARASAVPTGSGRAAGKGCSRIRAAIPEGAFPEEEDSMHIDRRAFLATLGSAAVVEAMSSEARADALEHYMLAQLDKAPAAKPADIRSGTGALFGGPSPSGVRAPVVALSPMPERPTLVDFLRLRGTPGIGNHILQSAGDAAKKGEPEETVLACLLHDYVLNLMKPDHGWWSAQMMEPYVSEKVSWAIRHHQALRFYADPSVGYEYPELYVRIFGKDYVPAPYIKAS